MAATRASPRVKNSVALLTLRFEGPDEGPPLVVGHSARGVYVWRTPAGQVIASGHTVAGVCWMEWPGVATFRFADQGRFVTAFRAAGVSDSRVRDVYRRGVLPMALQALGHEALHASAVVVSGRVMAFAARAHTGKSTVAYGLSRRGYPQWADDGVVVSVEGDTVQAIPLPFDVRLRPESSDAFGLDPSRFRQFRPDHSVLIDAAPTPLGAIFLLDRDAAAPLTASIRRMDPTEAFGPVLVHAHEFNPFNLERRRRMIEAYLALVAIVPVYGVRFRPGFEYFDGVLDAIAGAMTAESLQ